MEQQTTSLNQFIEFSAALTDFNEFALNGTGQVSAYYKTVVDIAGQGLIDQMLLTFSAIVAKSQSEGIFIEGIRKQILGDLKLGPVARNIMKLWYTGTWYQLPNQWRETYGKSDDDLTFFVNSASYMEGLLWQAIDANPSGAKAPGYGSWSQPPNINFNNAWQFKPTNLT